MVRIDMESLAPHGGCTWEGCKICNTEHSPYPTSWKPKEKAMINTDQTLELLDAIRDHIYNDKDNKLDLSLNEIDAANLVTALVTLSRLVPNSTWPEKFVRELAASFHINWE